MPKEFEKPKKKMEIEGATSVVSQQVLPTSILDVSGYNNNCGLYAFALGVHEGLKLISKDNAAKIPASSFPVVNHSQVLWSTDIEVLRKIGTQLRILIYDKLTRDEEYKHEARRSFQAEMIAKYTSRMSNPDMTAFVQSNKDFISQLDSNINEFEQAIVDEQIDVAIVNFTIEPSIAEISKLASEFLAILQSPNGPNVIIQKLDESYNDYFSIHKNELKAVLLTLKLRNNAWDMADFSKVRYRFRRHAKQALDLKSIDLLLAFLNQASNKLNALINLGYILSLFDKTYENECSTLHANAALLAKELFIRHEVNKAWDAVIYPNYTQFIKNTSVMLTEGELSVLARAFHVNFYIEGHTEPRTDFGDITVTLKNDNRVHWMLIKPQQVYRMQQPKVTVAPIAKSDSPLIVAKKLSTKKKTELDAAKEKGNVEKKHTITSSEDSSRTSPSLSTNS